MSGAKKRIDWEQVKARLRDSQQALERVLTVSPERLEAIYRERAARLAGRQTPGAGPAAARRVLAFVLRGERYALEFADLAAIRPYAGATPVPGGPPVLLGVINIDGDIRSVVDLARLLELPGGENGADGYVLVVRRHGRQVALRVDQLDKIFQVGAGDLVVPEGSTGPAAHFLRGLTPDRLRLLNTDALLAHPLFGPEAKQ
jgi:purine-binding chemotaxis protein CheW